MKNTMELINELNAQTNELWKMNLSFEDEIALYTKLVHKTNRACRRHKMVTAWLNAKALYRSFCILVCVVFYQIK